MCATRWRRCRRRSGRRSSWRTGAATPTGGRRAPRRARGHHQEPDPQRPAAAASRAGRRRHQHRPGGRRGVMSEPRDESLDELLGAYALDAVDEAERRRIEAYLAANPTARSEVADHREVAALLAVGSEPPPEGLWDRIAGALDERPPEPGPRL